MTIADVKRHIDIVDVVGDYVELKGSGDKLQARENPIREEKTSSFFIYRQTQRYFDFGTGEGGDVIDFIQKAERSSPADAKQFLIDKYLGGIDIKSNFVPRPRPEPIKKDNKKLMAALAIKAEKYLNDPIVKNGRKRERYVHFTLETDQAKEVALVNDVFAKLFETSYIETDNEILNYIFKKYIGYDSYFNCPAIILRDINGDVVNIIKYRPVRDGYNDLPKYLYLPAEAKPDSSYLYPFQFEMERMMLKHGFAYLGEGLKNAVIALAYGLPYISIESSSNVSDRLVEYLRSERWRDTFFIGAFDGDQAGEKAYNKICESVPMENKFSFDSGIDFADYVRKEYKI